MNESTQRVGLEIKRLKCRKMADFKTGKKENCDTAVIKLENPINYLINF